MLLNPFKIFDTPFHQFDVNVSLVPSTTVPCSLIMSAWRPL